MADIGDSEFLKLCRENDLDPKAIEVLSHVGINSVKALRMAASEDGRNVDKAIVDDIATAAKTLQFNWTGVHHRLLNSMLQQSLSAGILVSAQTPSTPVTPSAIITPTRRTSHSARLLLSEGADEFTTDHSQCRQPVVRYFSRETLLDKLPTSIRKYTEIVYCKSDGTAMYKCLVPGCGKQYTAQSYGVQKTQPKKQFYISHWCSEHNYVDPAHAARQASSPKNPVDVNAALLSIVTELTQLEQDIGQLRTAEPNETAEMRSLQYMLHLRKLLASLEQLQPGDIVHQASRELASKRITGLMVTLEQIPVYVQCLKHAQEMQDKRAELAQANLVPSLPTSTPVASSTTPPALPMAQPETSKAILISPVNPHLKRPAQKESSRKSKKANVDSPSQSSQ